MTFVSPADRLQEARWVAEALAALVDKGSTRIVVISTIDGVPASQSPFANALRDVGFVETIHGYAKRRAFEPLAARSLSESRDAWGRPWDVSPNALERARPDPLGDDDADAALDD